MSYQMMHVCSKQVSKQGIVILFEIHWWTLCQLTVSIVIMAVGPTRALALHSSAMTHGSLHLRTEYAHMMSSNTPSVSPLY